MAPTCAAFPHPKLTPSRKKVGAFFQGASLPPANDYDAK